MPQISAKQALMGRKGRKNDPVPQSQLKEVKDTERVKFVSVANSWCKTIVKDGKQIQLWVSTKAEAEKAEIE